MPIQFLEIVKYYHTPQFKTKYCQHKELHSEYLIFTCEVFLRTSSDSLL